MSNGSFTPEDPEVIQVVPPGARPGARWQPIIGSETLALLETLVIAQESKARLLEEAVAVLAKCEPPLSPVESTTGLVVGHVQSGKTMSFTTVAALARDNGFQLVVVITGISIPLFAQSRARLQRDLRLNTRPDRKWQSFSNPTLRGNVAHTMAGTFRDWWDPRVPERERQTVLITVMKNHRHLDNLIQVLSDPSLDLANVPTVVIDDEADQASLNNLVRQGRESTTYRRLLDLRRCLPRHSYLQYTATPQAPLLINLIDALSPRFAEVLTPGPDYVGGREFFLEERHLVHPIPVHEVPTPNNPLTAPPESLLEAMRIFFLGVAAGIVVDEMRGNRSMMVHPSRETMAHADYRRWVSETRHQWQVTLELDEGDPDRCDLLTDFAAAHEDLRETVNDLPPFEALAQILPRAIRRTQVTEVNAVGGRTPEIDWSANYAHLLVGGQAMDRGFTVEGLTVTYMPRGLGVGNADTVQQRARFFGYKRRYLGYCRIYLEVAGLTAYRHYVEHEEDVRERLIEYQNEGRPLSDWKRAFFLNLALRPTRHSVLSLDYMRDSFEDQWFTPGAPHDSLEAVEGNRQVIEQFLGELALEPDAGHPDRTQVQRHQVASGVPLRGVYEELLTQLRITRPSDSQRFIGLLLQIEAYLQDHEDAVCTIYRMSPNAVRRRSLSDGDDEILNLYQGAAPVNPPERRGEVYPGDQQIRGPEGLTVQIHYLTLQRDGQDAYENVPTVAVWVPGEMSRGWLVQDQGGH